MRSSTLSTLLLSSSSAALTSAQGSPGYGNITSTIPSSSNFTFSATGNYALLNLDLINGIVDPVVHTTAGNAFISSTASWIDYAHSLTPAPLQIFTRIYFSTPLGPEVGPQSPFLMATGGSKPTIDSAFSQIYPAFDVREGYDVVLQKTRYAADFGNQLDEILRAQLVKTVVLSGIRTSGVIASTVYDLFDKDYQV